MEPIEWLTVGLVIFAGAQVWIQQRNSTLRVQEVDRERNELIDLAATSLQAEWFRIWAVAHEWETRDVIEDIGARVFDPDDILPADRTGSVTALARLGPTSAFLAVRGLAEVERAARIAKDLRAFVEKHNLSEFTGTHTEAGYRVEAREMIKLLRAHSMEAANCLQDAIEHSPTADNPRAVEVKDKVRSECAKSLKQRVAETGKGS